MHKLAVLKDAVFGARSSVDLGARHVPPITARRHFGPRCIGLPNEATRRRWLWMATTVVTPIAVDHGFDWERHVDEMPSNTWLIQGMRPPSANAEAKRHWIAGRCNGTGRLSCCGASRPVPLHHRAKSAQMTFGLRSPLDETTGPRHDRQWE